MGFLAHPDEMRFTIRARERVVLIDPERNVKTEITTLRLERLSVSLASWARKADDRLVRWAGGPDFGNDIQETNETIELSGPRARYLVAFEQAPSAESAGRVSTLCRHGSSRQSLGASRWTSSFSTISN